MREILIKSVVADNTGVEIQPVKCPGVGKFPILTNNAGDPACIYGYDACKYLNKVEYSESNQEKLILCEIP